MPSGTGQAPPDGAHPALRLALFYVASFAVLGIYLPYRPVWLQSRGCQNVADVLIGLILARTIAGPWLSQRVDRSGRGRAAVVWLSFGSLLALFPFLLAESFWALFACGFLFGLVYPPIHPIVDNLTLAAGRMHGFDYGRVRLWGSLSFLVVNVVGGVLLGSMPFSRDGGPALPPNAPQVFWWVAAALLCMALASLWLPRDQLVAPAAARSAIGALLRDRRFLLFLVGTGCVQGSHAAYYSFASLRWLEAGIAPATVGVLWAEGVLAEVLLFLCMRRLVRRARPRTLLLLGGAGAAVRWVVFYATTSVPLLLVTNWLHALSFACVHAGSLLYLFALVPQQRMATAQGLMAAASSGVFLIAGNKVAGWLYPLGAGTPFLAMAAMALLGLWLCARLDRD